MKKQTYICLAIAGALGAAVMSSHADNSAFPPIDEREQAAAEQTPRFFVKYFSGKEQQALSLLRSHQLEVVDSLEGQQVFVVSGQKKQVEKLTQSEFIDYVEPEPTRRLLSQ